MPSLPTVTSDIPRDLRQYIDRVRENIDGVGLDELITARKLIAAGLAQYTGGSLTSPTGTTSYATPPSPLNLDADGALLNIIVTWDKAVYNGHSYTEIWASTQTAAQAAASPVQYPDLGEAELVGMAPGSVWVHNLGGGASRWYWARFVNVEGQVGPFNLVDGTRGDTATDPAYLIGLLSNQISEGELASALTARINLIDGGEALAGSVAARMATIQGQVNTLLNLPAWSSTDTYAIGDQVVHGGFLYAALAASTNVTPTSAAAEWNQIGEYATIGAAVAAHTNQISTLQTADTNQVTATSTLAAQLRGDYVGSDLTLISQGLIYDERTARSDANATMAQSINTVSAFVNTKTRTFYQATAPTGTAEQPLNEGDMWIDTDVTYADDYVAGDYVIQSNRMYRYDGTSWLEAMDFGFADWFSAIRTEKTSRITDDTALAQQITTLVSNTAASLATINETLTTTTGDLTSEANKVTNLTATVGSNNSTLTAAVQAEQSARADQDTAIAEDIVLVQATLGDDLTAAVLVETEARVAKDGSIEAKNTVKIDVAGHVSGYGLIATNNTGTPTAEFGIRADSFWIAPPAISSSSTPTTNLYPGYVWRDTSAATHVTKYYNGSSFGTTPQNLPFIVRTSPIVINGETVEPGVYMESAWIANGTITNAKIGNAAIDNAKIANLNAAKITAGFLDADRIEAGTVTATMIDSRGLSIKDANGDVILSAGIPLNISNIAGLGTLAAFSEISLSDIASIGALASLDEVREEDLVTGLAGKIDGKLESFFQVSTDDPGADWTGDTRTLHLGDIWWKTDLNTMHRYKYADSIYSWEQITDEKATNAFANAATAQDTADGKRRVFVDEPVPPYDRGDLWDRGPTTGIYRCATAKAADGSFLGADWTVVADLTGNNTAGSITDQGALATLSAVAYANLESGLAGQLDGKVETFFSLVADDPVDSWETNEAGAVTTATKTLHLGDLWWQTDAYTLRRYYYNGTAYEWQQITDQKAIDAFDNASTAQDTADGKRRVFISTPTGPYDRGDLWDRGSTLGLWRAKTAIAADGTWSSSHWQVAADTTADNDSAGFEGQGALATLSEVAYGSLAATLAGLIDGKVEQHYGSSDPQTAWTTADAKTIHLNDLWYHTTDKRLYLYVQGDDPTTAGTTETFFWEVIEDQAAIDAADAASDAQDTADGKRRVFTAAPVPPYDVGDLWDRGSAAGGGIWRCKTARASSQTYALAHWQVVADTTSTGTASAISGQGDFALLDEITAGNISTYIAAGAIGNAYIGNVIQSGNYVLDTSGWKIDKTGGMEMNNATFRGTIDVGGTTGSRLVIKSDRIEVYDGATLRVRLGNLAP